MAEDPKPEGAPIPPEDAKPEPPKAPEPAATAAPKPPAAPAAKPPAAAAAGAAKPAAPPPPKAPAVMVTTPWEGELPEAMKAEFGDSVKECVSYLGQNFAVVKHDAVIGLLCWLKDEKDFDYLVDITAVHWPKRDEAFDLVYILYSFSRNERIRIKAMIPEGTKPATAVDVHLTADWLEREVFDMFGIEFTGHPNMKRILLPDEWDGHPLRKDYGILQMDNRWVQENLGIESGQ